MRGIRFSGQSFSGKVKFHCLGLTGTGTNTLRFVSVPDLRSRFSCLYSTQRNLTIPMFNLQHYKYIFDEQKKAAQCKILHKSFLQEQTIAERI